MYFEDYGYTTEPSNLDKILEEAVDKVRQEINGAVQTELSNVNKLLNNKDIIECELRSHNLELERVKRQIEELKAKYEKLDNHNLPKSIVQKMVKAVIDDFYLGQEVYVINREEVSEKCELCKGNKKITVDINNNKTDVACPSCEGRGYNWKSEYSINKEKISCIDLKLCFREDHVNYWTKDCIYLAKHEYSSKKENLFATKEEAEARLKELRGE